MTWRRPFRCSRCGKFISSKDGKAIVYTTWGSSYDPPEDEYICGKCSRPEDITINVWRKPTPMWRAKNNQKD